MGRAFAYPIASPDQIIFDVDRFERVDDDRLEVSGRWFGVRGRRFMRPSLTLLSSEGEVRLLADLEHKPWAAEDGEEWHAAFLWSGDLGDVGEAELALSPDLAVQLSPPGGSEAGPTKARKRTPRQPPRRGTIEARPAAAPSDRQQEITKLRQQVESLTRELARVRAKFDDEIDALRQRTAEAQKAGERAIAERNEALAERAQVRADRDAALAERNAAAHARDAAIAERDGERDLRRQVVAERDAALAVRDPAVVRRDQALAQREAESAARALAESERDELQRAYEDLKLQHDQLTTARGAALVMRNASMVGQRSGREVLWLTVAIGVAMLVVVALVVAIALH